MLKKRQKSALAERLEPGAQEGAWCAPGSIEQQLDMCEEGDLRGDQIEHSHGQSFTDPDALGTPEGGEPLDLLIQVDESAHRFQLLADPDREDDEMTGDEHSQGLQGEESELENQDHLDTGIPGEETHKESHKRPVYRSWD